MTDDKDIKSIFAHALEIDSPDERREYIQNACNENSHLEKRVEALLESHQQVDGFLETAPLDQKFSLNDPSPLEEVGQMIGRYKLLQKIGEGGFGVVYMA